MKGSMYYYSQLPLEIVLEHFEKFGDFIECDADRRVATFYVNTDI